MKRYWIIALLTNSYGQKKKEKTWISIKETRSFLASFMLVFKFQYKWKTLKWKKGAVFRFLFFFLGSLHQFACIIPAHLFTFWATNKKWFRPIIFRPISLAPYPKLWDSQNRTRKFLNMHLKTLKVFPVTGSPLEVFTVFHFAPTIFFCS